MIDLYTWSTPNGRKASIALEELGLDYRVHAVDIGNGDQHKPEFLAVNPNGRIPAIVDQDAAGGPLTIFESGAILIHLAERTGQLLPTEPRERAEVLEWLMWQVGGVGPMLGQTHHFRRFAPHQIPYAIDRYTKEAQRLYGVLDRRLGDSEFLARAYSIADIATFPWIARWEWQGVALSEFPNVRRWFDVIARRPAVQAGMKVPPL